MKQPVSVFGSLAMLTLVSLLSLQAFAQDSTSPQGPDPDSTDPATASEAAEPGVAREQEPPVDSAATEPPATAATDAPGEGDSPFDYQASEQISEDLSVSFPIDI